MFSKFFINKLILLYLFCDLSNYFVITSLLHFSVYIFHISSKVLLLYIVYNLGKFITEQQNSIWKKAVGKFLDIQRLVRILFLDQQKEQ